LVVDTNSVLHTRRVSRTEVLRKPAGRIGQDTAFIDRPFHSILRLKNRFNRTEYHAPPV